MAKIEMDISEYESMKENKVLLEKSLEKERALQKEIKKLTDEKVEALEAAQRKIVKVSKKEVTEHLVFKRNAYDINIHRSVARAVFNIISSKDRVGSAEIIELQKSLFEKVRSYSEPVEEITTHGLDDIGWKRQIRLFLKIENWFRISMNCVKKTITYLKKLIGC